MMMESSKFESFIADGDTASPKKFKSEEKLIIKKEKKGKQKQRNESQEKSEIKKSVSKNDNKLNRRKSARELKKTK